MSLRLPDTYRTERLIKIGRAFDHAGTLINIPDSAHIVSVDDIVHQIPFEYAEEARGFLVKGEKIGRALLKVITEAPDQKRAAEISKSIVIKLIDKHSKLLEESIRPYNNRVEILEADIKLLEALIQRKREKLDNGYLELRRLGTLMNDEAANSGLFLVQRDKNVEYNLALELNIQRIDERLLEYRNEILMYGFRLANLQPYKTQTIGSIKEIYIVAKKTRIVMLAGVVGIIMFLFLAFLIEYIVKARKVKGDPV